MIRQYTDYEYFNTRSGYYKNLFDPSIGFFRPKDDKGAWMEPFSPISPIRTSLREEPLNSLWVRSPTLKWLNGPDLIKLNSTYPKRGRLKNLPLYYNTI